jgi:hypothetical protein
MCDACGTYRGRQVVDMQAKVTKKLVRTQRKRTAMGMLNNQEEVKSEDTKKADKE